MWIKSLTRDTWVNVNHITHYDIRASKPPNVKGYCNVVAHLAENKLIEDQTYVTVKRGNYEECEQFVNDQTFLQAAYQWIGYLVAGGVGAVLTFFFSRLGS